jgi:hypothetical protein
MTITTVTERIANIEKLPAVDPKKGTSPTKKWRQKLASDAT